MLTKKDLEYIHKKGITLEQVESQITLFKKGIPFSNLQSAATINSGIIPLKDFNVEELIAYYDSKIETIKAVKFVPASGAASRMFKFLFQFIEQYENQNEPVNIFFNTSTNPNLKRFLKGLKSFPFYAEVLNEVKANTSNYDALTTNEKSFLFIKTMLDEDKLNMSFLPKGLLPFHKYKKHITTAFEEHLNEAKLYLPSNNKAHLHFTISKAHNQKFKSKHKEIEEPIENNTKIKFMIDFSFQNESTDTLAVNKSYEPFRDDNGDLVFRPGGHGALIENLNSIDADIIFIKNIDNVVVIKYSEDVAKYKKILAAHLLQIQDQVFTYAKKLESEVSQELINNIAFFLENNLNVKLNSDFKTHSTSYQIEHLKKHLNKPIRVCGMVKNEGEPGGGPFWVKDANGKQSLQIVESAQIDLSNTKQKRILEKSTHFNPVDIVCGVKNYKGEKYDLKKFVDHNAVFISKKSNSGKELLALELPGLWNGGMAYWNTIFVEMPLITFSPVKTVNDLLKPAHQPA